VSSAASEKINGRYYALNMSPMRMEHMAFRVLTRLDYGQPLVEVARKMKAIEGMQPQVNDMERRLGIMQSDTSQITNGTY